jgi:hypothetical protein
MGDSCTTALGKKTIVKRRRLFLRAPHLCSGIIDPDSSQLIASAESEPYPVNLLGRGMCNE